MAKPVAVIAAVKAGPQPPIADWYVGTYGINPADAKKIRAKGCRYATVFAIKKGFRDTRKLPADDAAKLDPTFAGPIPGARATSPSETGCGSLEATGSSTSPRTTRGRGRSRPLSPCSTSPAASSSETSC